MNDSKTCKSFYNIKQHSNYKPTLVNVCLGAKPTSSSSTSSSWE